MLCEINYNFDLFFYHISIISIIYNIKNIYLFTYRNHKEVKTIQEEHFFPASIKA